MKKVLFAVSLLFFSFNAFTAEIKDAMDEVAYIYNQMHAVDVEFMFFYGWGEEYKDAAREAISQVNGYIEELNKIREPQEVFQYKNGALKFGQGQVDLYETIISGTKEEIQNQYSALEDINSATSLAYMDLLKKYSILEQIPENKDELSVELGYFREEDRTVYEKAYNFYVAKEYNNACKIYKSILIKYEGMLAGQLLNVRMADCMVMHETDLEPSMFNIKSKFDFEEKAMGIYYDVLDGEVISPFMFEAYMKWRALHQDYNHGASNMSVIPNKMYNEQRWRAVNKIKKYLKQHPDDIRVGAQVDLFLMYHNITRGGAFGNNNIRDRARLFWPELFKDKD